MIKVIVKNNVAREEVVTETTSTPLSIFNEKGIDVAGSQVNLNGRILTSSEYSSTFEALGITDGSTVSLNSVVKADGANN